MAKFSDSTTQTLAVIGTPAIVLKHNAGEVTITTSDVHQVEVTATKHVHANSEAEAQKQFDAMSITADQSADTITIRSKYAQGWLEWGHWNEYRRIDLAITLPRQANLRVRFNAGRLHVTGLTGTFDLDANACEIRLDEVTFVGDNVLKYNAGDLRADGQFAPSAALQVRMNAGKFALIMPKDTPAHFEVHCTAGDIKIRDLPIESTRHFISCEAIGDLQPNPTNQVKIDANAGEVVLTGK